MSDFLAAEEFTVLNIPVPLLLLRQVAKVARLFSAAVIHLLALQKLVIH
jgi:hypothetical protein